MRDILIIANLKMNMVHRRDVVSYCDRVRAAMATAPDLKKGVRLVICPSAPHFDVVQRLAHVEPRIALGAQDVFWERRGSYTGQLSPVTLADSGVRYALVGHSEQRTYGHVSDEEIGKKVAALILAEITPVIFVGETEHERAAGRIKDALTSHMRAIMQHVRAEDIARCVFVYEPVWAIGATTPPTPEELMSARILLQKIIADTYGATVAHMVQFLYGGSVTPQNAAMFTPDLGIEGVVLGRAGTQAPSFVQVAATIAHQHRT